MSLLRPSGTRRALSALVLGLLVSSALPLPARAGAAAGWEGGAQEAHGGFQLVPHGAVQLRADHAPSSGAGLTLRRGRAGLWLEGLSWVNAAVELAFDGIPTSRASCGASWPLAHHGHGPLDEAEDALQLGLALQSQQ